MITASSLHVRIGGRSIVDGISFEVAGGESVALVGPNGSGKTTLLRALLGLVPFEGSASIGGHDVTAAPLAARAATAYVPQRPAFEDATAAEVLAFVARLRRKEPRRVAEVLEEVGLAGHARARVRTFSGGMLERLSFAAALLTDASVWLLDEPTASLDRDGQDAFFALARRLRAAGRTLLVSSHRPEEVARVADRVLHLEAGRIVSIEAVHEAKVVALPAATTHGRRRS